MAPNALSLFFSLLYTFSTHPYTPNIKNKDTDEHNVNLASFFCRSFIYSFGLAPLSAIRPLITCELCTIKKVICMCRQTSRSYRLDHDGSGGLSMVVVMRANLYYYNTYLACIFFLSSICFFFASETWFLECSLAMPKHLTYVL